VKSIRVGNEWRRIANFDRKIDLVVYGIICVSAELHEFTKHKAFVVVIPVVGTKVARADIDGSYI
jgi:hypothetical protein